MDKRQQIIGEWIQLIPRTYFNWQGDCIIYADIYELQIFHLFIRRDEFLRATRKEKKRSKHLLD